MDFEGPSIIFVGLFEAHCSLMGATAPTSLSLGLPLNPWSGTHANSMDPLQLASLTLIYIIITCELGFNGFLNYIFIKFNFTWIIIQTDAKSMLGANSQRINNCEEVGFVIIHILCGGKKRLFWWFIFLEHSFIVILCYISFKKRKWI